MALGKQQFFFPFFLFVNSRHILWGPVYASYDLLSPLNGQSYLIKITAWVWGGGGEALSRAHSLPSERTGSFCLSLAGGRGQTPIPEHPSSTASLQHSIPPSAEHSSSGLQIKDYRQYNRGARPLNYPSRPPAKKNILLRKERIRCCSAKDGIIRKRVKVLNRQPRAWTGLCFKFEILPMSY